MALEPIFSIFVALETGSKIDEFHEILGSYQILRPSLVGGKCVGLQALSNTIPPSLNTTLEILRPKLGVLPRSLVAPSRGAGGFEAFVICVSLIA